MAHPKLLEGEVRVVGHRWSPRVHELKTFLARSRVRFRWLDLEENDNPLAAGRDDQAGRQYPIVLLPDGTVLVQPDVRRLAEALGLDTEPDSRFYDLIVVGGGPAGLAAAIVAASEGLHTVVVEQEVTGGQATYSAIIENYPGFPRGLSGSDLARRTTVQAERFGAEVLVTRRATRLCPAGQQRAVSLDEGTELTAQTILLALGVSFRWLDAKGCPALMGAGIYYGAATAEATACRNQDVSILGGGNSAGQAVLLLSPYARHVILITANSSLEETMSQYLIDRIREMANVTVLTDSSVMAADGTGHLEGITVQNLRSGETRRLPVSSLFVFIGATPRTEWLDSVVARDAEGFILSGRDLLQEGRTPAGWSEDREPYELETSTPGVFVAGDVRKGSVKRIASAVGEGTNAVQFIHRYLRQQRTRPASTPGVEGALQCLQE